MILKCGHAPFSAAANGQNTVYGLATPKEDQRAFPDPDPPAPEADRQCFLFALQHLPDSRVTVPPDVMDEFQFAARLWFLDGEGNGKIVTVEMPVQVFRCPHAVDRQRLVGVPGAVQALDTHQVGNEAQQFVAAVELTQCSIRRHHIVTDDSELPLKKDPARMAGRITGIRLRVIAIDRPATLIGTEMGKRRGLPLDAPERDRFKKLFEDTATMPCKIVPCLGNQAKIESAVGPVDRVSVVINHSELLQTTDLS